MCLPSGRGKSGDPNSVLTAVTFNSACQVVRRILQLAVVVREPNSDNKIYVCTYSCSLWMCLPSGPVNSGEGA